jgi:hypothetical protein
MGLYDTKIKDFSFKFYVDNKKAQVLIDIEHRSDEKRTTILKKLSPKEHSRREFVKTWLKKGYVLENGKTISQFVRSY